MCGRGEKNASQSLHLGHNHIEGGERGGGGGVKGGGVGEVAGSGGEVDGKGGRKSTHICKARHLLPPCSINFTLQVPYR